MIIREQWTWLSKTLTSPAPQHSFQVLPQQHRVRVRVRVRVGVRIRVRVRVRVINPNPNSEGQGVVEGAGYG